jgi:hypothetical protein
MLVAQAAGHCVLRQVVCVSRERSRTEHQDQAGVLNFTRRQALVVQMLYNSDVWSLSAEAQNEEAARSATTSAIRCASASLPCLSSAAQGLCKCCTNIGNVSFAA